MSVYTRKGDDGSTRLYGTPERFLKSDPVFECLGDLDELNALLGVIRSQSSMKNKNKDFLISIQEDILTISGEVAGYKSKKNLNKYFKERVEEMEKLIDKISKDLPDLSGFVLPGESLEEASIHQARAVCRRAERKFIGFIIETGVTLPEIKSYINRLSDLLFVFALHSNL